LICFYLLPAFAAILKTRKRKLAQISSNFDDDLVVNTNFSAVIKSTMDHIGVKLGSLITVDTNSAVTVTSGINKGLNTFLAVELPSNLLFNTAIFRRAQVSYFIYV